MGRLKGSKNKPKIIKKPENPEINLLKELKNTNTILSEIRFILDNMWRERRPE